MFITGWSDKENTVYTQTCTNFPTIMCAGTFGQEKGKTATCKNQEPRGHYAKWNKPQSDEYSVNRIFKKVKLREA